MLSTLDAKHRLCIVSGKDSFSFRRRGLLQNENIKCDDKRQYFQAVLLLDECSCDRWLLLSGCQWLHLFSTLSFIPRHAPGNEVIAYILVS